MDFYVSCTLITCCITIWSKLFNIKREVLLQPESRLALQIAQEVQLIERRDQSEETGSHNTHLLRKNSYNIFLYVYSICYMQTEYKSHVLFIYIFY